MATILDNIRKVHTGFVNDKPKQTELLLTLKPHAVKAMINGIGSEDAKNYMSMFVDSEKQLNLLTNPNDVEGMPWLHEVQAYLVANSICAPSTNGQTGNGIFDEPGETGLKLFDADPPAATEATILERRPKEFKALVFP